MTSGSRKLTTANRWGQAEAAAGAIVAVLLLALNPAAPTWLSYLLLWLPMLTAVIAAGRRRNSIDKTASVRINIRITWFDLLVGAFAGLLLRMAMMLAELTSVGHVTSSSSMFDYERNLLWVATAIVAPGIIAPVVEELFFRGLVLPAVGVNWLGIISSATIFSAIHLLVGFNALTATSTFIAGILFGLLAVKTRRLGASIVAHIVYNSSLIAMSELGGMTGITLG